MILGGNLCLDHQLFQSPHPRMDVAHYECPHRKVFSKITHKCLAREKSLLLYNAFNL